MSKSKDSEAMAKVNNQGTASEGSSPLPTPKLHREDDPISASGRSRELQPRVPSAFTEPLIPESEWSKAGENSYVLIEDSLSVKGPLQHNRSLPLPLRVKSGRILEDRLVVETAGEIMEIPWQRVKFVTLGMVYERSETEATAYQVEKLVGGVGRMMKGGGSPTDGKIISYRETHLTDLYVDGIPEPLRFDSSQVNYRSFLKRVSFVSFQNYFRLVHSLSEHATEACFTPNVQYFLVWNRDFIQKFNALHEYEEDCMIRYGQLDKQILWKDLDLSRHSWAQEWTED